MGYLMYKAEYGKTFRKRPPHWLLIGQSLYDQIKTMQAAIEAGKPLPDSKTQTILIFPDDYFKK